MSSSDPPARDPVSGADLRAALGELPWLLVRDMIDQILREADRRNVRVVVAVMDRWGRQLAFQRQPGTVIASSAVAVGKALAACTFDAPTGVLVETISRHDQEELGRVNPGIVFAGGGFPIRVGGLLVGGIGVSGSSTDEDAELALGALERAGFDVEFGEGDGEDG